MFKLAVEACSWSSEEDSAPPTGLFFGGCEEDGFIVCAFCDEAALFHKDELGAFFKFDDGAWFDGEGGLDLKLSVDGIGGAVVVARPEGGVRFDSFVDDLGGETVCLVVALIWCAIAIGCRVFIGVVVAGVVSAGGQGEGDGEGGDEGDQL